MKRKTRIALGGTLFSLPLILVLIFSTIYLTEAQATDPRPLVTGHLIEGSEFEKGGNWYAVIQVQEGQ